MEPGDTRSGGGQRVLFAAVACCAVILVVLAAGTAAGRWRFVTPETKSPDVNLARSSLVVIVPVPASSLHAGDNVYFHTHNEPSALVRIERVTDASRHKFVASTATGSVPITLSETAWRSRRVVPLVGGAFRMLASWLPSLLLFFAGVALVVWDCWKHRRRAVAPVTFEESFPADLESDVVPASVKLALLAGSATDVEPAPVDPPAGL